jgi:hypothetical protein
MAAPTKFNIRKAIKTARNSCAHLMVKLRQWSLMTTVKCLMQKNMMVRKLKSISHKKDKEVKLNQQLSRNKNRREKLKMLGKIMLDKEDKV